MKKIYLYAFFFLFLFSCKHHKEKRLTNTKREVIHIDEIKCFEHIEEIIPDDFILNKKYIKIDSSHDEFLFKEIKKIRIIKDRIFIADGRLKKLLVFDDNGYPVAKIGNKGNGPDEYLDITDFDVDSKGNIYLIDGRLDKLFIYNPDYSFKKVLVLPFEVDIINIINDNKIMLGLSEWNKGENEGASIVIVDNNLKIQEVMAYYDEYVDNTFWVSHYSFVNTDKNIIYNKPISDDVFLFTKEGVLEKIIEFDFGKKSVPKEERKKIERNLHKFDSYNLLKWITIVTNDYVTGTFWEKRETKSFFIDRKRKQMYLSNSTVDSDIGMVAGFEGCKLIQFIIPGSERAQNNNNLPQDVKEHLENGDFVICVNELGHYE